jgi:uncharacterized protein (TIGR02596 family)
MNSKRTCSAFDRAAFTLVETLVVVSIIVLILALTGPSLLGTMQASKLTSAGGSMVGFLSEAQQLAVTLNTPVEVRFFRYKVAPDTFESYRSYQMFKVSTPSVVSGATVNFEELFEPLGQVFRLPEGVIIPHEPELSPMLDGEGFPDVTDDKPNGYSGVADAKYVAIRFMTDGTCRRVTSVAAGSNSIGGLVFQTLNLSYFTLAGNIGIELSVASLPKNFFTIQIDPFNGKTRSYRPGEY